MLLHATCYYTKRICRLLCVSLLRYCMECNIFYRFIFTCRDSRPCGKILTTLEVRILTYELPTYVYTQSLSMLLLPGPCRSECCRFVQIEGNMLHSVSSRHLGKGGKMVHAINRGRMCHVGMRSTAVARGVWGHAPRENF